MTDSHKQLSVPELAIRPKPGRPKSEKSLSNAERQRRYRLKKNGRTILLTAPEISILLWSLHHASEYAKSEHTYSELAHLMARLGNLKQGYDV